MSPESGCAEFSMMVDYNGSGANSGQVRDPLPLRRITALDRHQAASGAFHSSDMVASAPPRLPVLNCPFLIFSANSIPLIVTTPWSNSFEPEHRPDPLLHSTMVLFDQVIEILAG